MADDKFDAIVVGAGIAGCTAAYVLAKAGLQVLVIERGNTPGSKNMTGGRLYAHSLEKIIPGFADEAPVERRVTREKISFLTEDSYTTLDYEHAPPADPAEASYTVLRAKFDEWLMSKAEEAGAELVAGIRVDGLIMRDGKIEGIMAGGDEIEANTVILADGVNSILGESLGMAKNVTPHNMAVGVKELIELSPQVMQDRFGAINKDGLAWMFAGTFTEGFLGGGFLYTNQESVSLGLVFGLHNAGALRKSVPQMMEDFKNHPCVAPLVAGGKLIEYSAHVVPEGGLNMLSDLFGNGVLIAGDAAGMCLNLGFTVRGMDLAVASGEAAAKAVIAAKEKGDFSKEGLSSYRNLLEESFLMKDMRLYKGMPAFIDNPRMFTAYPKLFNGLMHDMFTVNGASAPVWRKGLKRARQVGLINLMKDGFKGMRSI